MKRITSILVALSALGIVAAVLFYILEISLILAFDLLVASSLGLFIFGTVRLLQTKTKNKQLGLLLYGTFLVGLLKLSLFIPSLIQADWKFILIGISLFIGFSLDQYIRQFSTKFTAWLRITSMLFTIGLIFLNWQLGMQDFWSGWTFLLATATTAGVVTISLTKTKA